MNENTFCQKEVQLPHKVVFSDIKEHDNMMSVVVISKMLENYNDGDQHKIIHRAFLFLNQLCNT